MKKLRIGFLSTANIGRKNWKSILNSGNCVVSAVASRDAQKSREFIHECQAAHAFEHAPAALGSYDALLTSPDVDAVYIPLPTGLRKEFVLRAAASQSKHVYSVKNRAQPRWPMWKQMLARLPRAFGAIHGRRHVHAQPGRMARDIA